MSKDQIKLLVVRRLILLLTHGVDSYIVSDILTPYRHSHPPCAVVITNPLSQRHTLTVSGKQYATDLLCEPIKFPQTRNCFPVLITPRIRDVLYTLVDCGAGKSRAFRSFPTL